MSEYKVLVVGGDEFLTAEYANQAESMEEAEEIAQKLHEEYDNGNYPDLRVEIYPIDEDIRHPEDNYPILLKDWDGNLVWREMVVGSYGGRIRIK